MASPVATGRWSFYPSATMFAAASEAPVAHDIGLTADIDRIIFADQIHVGPDDTDRRRARNELVSRNELVCGRGTLGIVGQPTIVRLMPGFARQDESSRVSLFVVDGGFDELRDVLAGR